MSHTSRISSIKIVDLNAFTQAVEDLRAQGLNITVKHNVVPKSYYDGQEGMSEPAHTVLDVEGCEYDVALYDIGQGQHELRTDFFLGHVEQAFAANQEAISAIDCSTDEGRIEREQAKLGRLYQRYALNATRNTVALQGGHIDEHVQEDGSIQLVIRQAA